MNPGESCLLDTMAVLWFAMLPEKLPQKARSVILDGEVPLSYSVVSLWEIALKLSASGYNDFSMPRDWERVLPDGLEQQGISRMGITPLHCRLVQDLPFHHRDPFDRMLVAQCMHGGMSIISSDKIFDDYEIKRVW